MVSYGIEREKRHVDYKCGTEVFEKSVAEVITVSVGWGGEKVRRQMA